jgi:hypothetical protein
LLQHRQHTLSKSGQMRKIALAAEQLAAKFILKLLDGARQ